MLFQNNMSLITYGMVVGVLLFVGEAAARKALGKTITTLIWTAIPQQRREGILVAAGKMDPEEMSDSEDFPLSVDYDILDEHGVSAASASGIPVQTGDSEEVQFTFNPNGHHDGWTVIFDCPNGCEIEPLFFSDHSIEHQTDYRYHILPASAECRIISEISRRESTNRGYMCVRTCDPERQLIEIVVGAAS